MWIDRLLNKRELHFGFIFQSTMPKLLISTLQNNHQFPLQTPAAASKQQQANLICIVAKM